MTWDDSFFSCPLKPVYSCGSEYDPVESDDKLTRWHARASAFINVMIPSPFLRPIFCFECEINLASLAGEGIASITGPKTSCPNQSRPWAHQSVGPAPVRRTRHDDALRPCRAPPSRRRVVGFGWLGWRWVGGIPTLHALCAFTKTPLAEHPTTGEGHGHKGNFNLHPIWKSGS